jgi:hypothetical protein
MKYLRADVTILLAAMVGGLMALGPAGMAARAAADLGRGRHAMYWCTEMGAADDLRGDRAADETALTEGASEADRSEPSGTADASRESTDDEHNYPYYGHPYYGREEGDWGEGRYATESPAADDEQVDDEADRWNDEESYAKDNYTEGQFDDEPVEEPTYEPSPSEFTADEPTDAEVNGGAADDEAAMDAEYADSSNSDSADQADAMDQDYGQEQDHGQYPGYAQDYGSDPTSSEVANTDRDSSAFEPEVHPWMGRMFNEYQPEASDLSDSEPREATQDEPSMGDDAWRYEYSYPESRYGYGVESEAADDEAALPDPCTESNAETDEMYSGSSEPQEANDESLANDHQSMWEEKYGYDAEEMSGRATDEEYANAEERADEQSDAEMDYAEYSPSYADAYTDNRESRDAASEQGPADESAWDGGPNEADLEQGNWMPSENNDPVQNEAQPAEGLERFGYLPQHLLIRPDQELLQELQRLADLSPGERQVAFRQYVESLGSVATEFATQYENITGDEAAMLTDDVASAAAFLAVYRLYEQGELGIDEAIDLLRQTLNHLSQEWMDGVKEITTESDFGTQHVVSLEGMTAPTSASAPRAVWVALSSWLNQRVEQWKSTLSAVWTTQLRGLNWQALVSNAGSDAGNYYLD